MTKHRTDNGVVYTPPELATELAVLTRQICDELDFHPQAIVDPCCGKGALLQAAARTFGLPRSAAHGWDIDHEAAQAGRLCGLNTYGGDVFETAGRAWPGDAAWVLNPPYVGRSNISRVLGQERFSWLKKTYTAKRSGTCDLAGYVLRHILAAYRPPVMGVVVTNTIFQGATRRMGTYWAVRNGYLIANVTPNRPWGEGAVVTVKLFVLVDARRFGLKEMTIQ